ncbi:hypothetical protein KL905_003797 [Ogataea polymorpha]|nr:hypothetical protein KL936_000203 [Ogataea polymorpha]KAG7918786.1 hypothetical protein KL905_003797 [Ogataea polymorpha]
MSVLVRSLEFLEPIIRGWDYSKPLFIGLEGPQGSGKTYVSTKLVKELSIKFQKLNIIRCSLDDFYLTFEEQENVSKLNRGNVLLQGRGLPGTHDLRLLSDCLAQIEKGSGNVTIPFYDKSLHNGKGDRAPENEWTHLQGRKVDVVLFEGWFVGYRAYKNEMILKHKWEEIRKQHEPKFDSVKYEHIAKLDLDLSLYEQIWAKFDCFLYITTSNLANVYVWRLEQEQSLIKAKGTDGKIGKIQCPL